MPERRVYIVEDERKLAELLRDYLEQDGFKVSIISRGDEAVGRVRDKTPDAVLLDLRLPGKDGMSICREIRSFSNVPILMITARVEEVDRLLGLELGADDYICKPFSPREVVARVKAVLRRVSDAPSSEKIEIGPIALDKTNHQVMIHGEQIHLTPSEFDLLAVLMSQPGRVFSRSDLVYQVQGYDFEGYERTVDTHIKNLRKKISDALPGEKIIRTIYSVGYSFEYIHQPQ
jgi:two-component system response regulator BaeR